VVQEVEYVKSEDKLARLGECLQKTGPPVLVFAEKTRDVDMVHEYLLVKGVDAVAIHGALSSALAVFTCLTMSEADVGASMRAFRLAAAM
jgi:superfamily II DNA/RNA helicase